MNILTRTINT